MSSVSGVGMSTKKSSLRSWVVGILLVICLVLAPGIRGYGNWRIDEYIIGMALPIAIILYQLISGKQFSISK